MSNKKSRAQRKQAKEARETQQQIRAIGGILGLLGLIIAAFFLLRPTTDTAVEVEATVGEEVAAANLPEVGTDVGLLAPNFELENMEGEKVKLSDFRGQPVALTFMHTW